MSVSFLKKIKRCETIYFEASVDRSRHGGASCCQLAQEERERQDGDSSGHAGLSDSLMWDSDDVPSLQHPLSRALERDVGEEGRGLM